MSANESSAVKQDSARVRGREHIRRHEKPRLLLSTTVTADSKDVTWQDTLRLPARRRPRSRQHVIAPAGNQSLSYLVAKRTLDVAGAAFLLLLLSPLLLAVFTILTITTKGHPIFAQERLGYLGLPFRLYKFRTMRLDAEKIRHQIQNEKDGPIFKNHQDPRVTRIGRLLRCTSLDEAPQLINVLCGQMSLVGPRPPLATEVAQYEPWQRIRLAVKPGLTCLWQVSGRSEIGFHRWMLMDSWYVKHQNLTTDLVLLIRTPWAILTRRGAY